MKLTCDMIKEMIGHSNIWKKNTKFAVIISDDVEFHYPVDLEQFICIFDEKDVDIVYLGNKGYIINKKGTNKLLSHISQHEYDKEIWSFLKETTCVKKIPLNPEVVTGPEKEVIYNQEWTDYNFYRGQDSFGGDVGYIKNKSHNELKKICDSNDICKGFNTYGWIKHTIVPLKKFNILGNTLKGGIYVKK